MGYEILRCPEIEPRINYITKSANLLSEVVRFSLCLTFVDDALKPNNGKQSAGDSSSGNSTQNDQTEQTACVATAFTFEEEVRQTARRLCSRHIEEMDEKKTLKSNATSESLEAA